MVGLSAGRGQRLYDHAVTDCEVAICTAAGEGRVAARVIPAAEVEQVTRGKGSNTRYVRNILPRKPRRRACSSWR